MNQASNSVIQCYWDCSIFDREVDYARKLAGKVLLHCIRQMDTRLAFELMQSSPTFTQLFRLGPEVNLEYWITPGCGDALYVIRPYSGVGCVHMFEDTPIRHAAYASRLAAYQHQCAVRQLAMESSSAIHPDSLDWLDHQSSRDFGAGLYQAEGGQWYRLWIPPFICTDEPWVTLLTPLRAAEIAVQNWMASASDSLPESLRQYESRLIHYGIDGTIVTASSVKTELDSILNNLANAKHILKEHLDSKKEIRDYFNMAKDLLRDAIDKAKQLDSHFSDAQAPWVIQKLRETVGSLEKQKQSFAMSSLSFSETLRRTEERENEIASLLQRGIEHTEDGVTCFWIDGPLDQYRWNVNGEIIEMSDIPNEWEMLKVIWQKPDRKATFKDFTSINPDVAPWQHFSENSAKALRLRLKRVLYHPHFCWHMTIHDDTVELIPIHEKRKGGRRPKAEA